MYRFVAVNRGHVSRGNKSVDTMIEDGSRKGWLDATVARLNVPIGGPPIPLSFEGMPRGWASHVYITPMLHIVHNDTSTRPYIFSRRKKGATQTFVGSRGLHRTSTVSTLRSCRQRCNDSPRSALYSLDQLSVGTLVAPPAGKL